MAITGIQNLALCSVFQLLLGGSPVLYTAAPRGNCENCCPIREPKDIRFLLFTKANPVKSRTLFLSDTKRINRAYVDKDLPLIFYLHGFSEGAPGTNGSSAIEMRDAFLETGNYNVILVDWSPLTALPWYKNAVENIPRVGRYVARFLRFLIESGVPLEKIHVVGFSLGGEVAGFVGKTLKEWGILLPRITALDPAFPGFMTPDTNIRLSSSDAKFVDVIHTDGGFFGFPYSIGHADFFPNGGIAVQPGCVQEEISKNRWLGILVGCSHKRAWQFFVESVRRPNAFLVSKCENVANESKECMAKEEAFMGLQCSSKLRGKFYLRTNSESPFGMNFPL